MIPFEERESFLLLMVIGVKLMLCEFSLTLERPNSWLED